MTVSTNPAANATKSATIAHELMRRYKTYLQNKQYKKAQQTLDHYLMLVPNDAEAWTNYGVVLRRNKMSDAAVPAYRRAISLLPKWALPWSNLGIALLRLNRLDEAENACRRAIQLEQGNATFLQNLAVVLREQQKFQEAEQVLLKAVRLKPDNASIHWDIADIRLRLGQYQSGLTLYHRWRHQYDPNVRKRGENLPVWDGRALNGETVFVNFEQGLGDSLITWRFLPWVKAQGARILLESPKPLLRLAASLPDVAQVIHPDSPTPDADWRISIMDLPRLAGCELDTVPEPANLTVPADARQRIRRVMASHRRHLNIGIVWRGRESFVRNQARSVDLNFFLPLAEFSRIRLFSLQKGESVRQLYELGSGALIFDLGAHLIDMADTAAAITELDLVMTIDSAVANLAGTLNRPVWNMLDANPYWLYGTEGETTPWYPSMRLARQPTAGDWKTVQQWIVDNLHEKLSNS